MALERGAGLSLHKKKKHCMPTNGVTLQHALHIRGMRFVHFAPTAALPGPNLGQLTPRVPSTATLRKTSSLDKPKVKIRSVNLLHTPSSP